MDRGIDGLHGCYYPDFQAIRYSRSFCQVKMAVSLKIFLQDQTVIPLHSHSAQDGPRREFLAEMRREVFAHREDSSPWVKLRESRPSATSI